MGVIAPRRTDPESRYVSDELHIPYSTGMLGSFSAYRVPSLHASRYREFVAKFSLPAHAVDDIVGAAPVAVRRPISRPYGPMSASDRPLRAAVRRPSGEGNVLGGLRLDAPGGAGALAEAARKLGMSEQDILDLALARSAWRSMVSVRLGAGNVRLAWSKIPMPALMNLSELAQASAFACVDRERILHDDSAPTVLERADGNWGPMARRMGVVGLGRGGAVRRSETFFIPIASCLQGTILASTPARPPTAGSVARGHKTFWLSAAATLGRDEMSHRGEMVTMIARFAPDESGAPI
jgi:hypothetical protein